MERYFLGIDIGTFESRGILIDESFRVVADRGRSVSLCGGKMRRFHPLCRKHLRCCSSRQECQSSSLPWSHPSDR